jgi:hypothetical protein
MKAGAYEQIAAALDSEGLPPRSRRSWNAVVVNRILRLEARTEAEERSAVAGQRLLKAVPGDQGSGSTVQAGAG